MVKKPRFRNNVYLELLNDREISVLRKSWAIDKQKQRKTFMEKVSVKLLSEPEMSILRKYWSIQKAQQQQKQHLLQHMGFLDTNSYKKKLS